MQRSSSCAEQVCAPQRCLLDALCEAQLLLGLASLLALPFTTPTYAHSFPTASPQLPHATCNWHALVQYQQSYLAPSRLGTCMRRVARGCGRRVCIVAGGCAAADAGAGALSRRAPGLLHAAVRRPRGSDGHVPVRVCCIGYSTRNELREEREKEGGKKCDALMGRSCCPSSALHIGLCQLCCSSACSFARSCLWPDHNMLC